MSTTHRIRRLAGAWVSPSGTVGEPPPFPFSVVPTPGSEEVRLDWSAYPGATGYVVKVNTQSPVQVERAVTTYTCEDLSNGRSYLFTVEALGSGGVILAVAECDATPIPPVEGLLLINCGGGISGSWSGDRDYIGIPSRTLTRAYSGYGDAVFQTARIDPVGYRIPIANGCYTVSLLFAEPEVATAAGQRVTHWYVNGQSGSVDVVAQVGVNGTVTVDVPSVSVRDGNGLDIHFYSEGPRPPLICGIRVAVGSGCLAPAQPSSADLLNLIANTPNGGTLNLTRAIYSVPSTIMLVDKSITINGNGSTFLFTNRDDGWYEGRSIEISGSSNVTMRNVTIDHNPLCFTQGTVVAMNGRTADVNIDAGYPDPAFWATSTPVWHAHFDSSGRWKGIIEGTVTRLSATAARLQLSWDGVLLGDRMALLVRTERGGNAIDIVRGYGNVLMDCVTLHGAGALAFYGQRRRGGTITFRFPRVVPGPPPPGATRPRLVTSNMDCWRGVMSTGPWRVFGGEMTRHADDGCNFQGYPGVVTNVVSSTVVDVTLVPDWNELPYLFTAGKGQTIRFMGLESNPPATRANIAAVRQISAVQSLGGSSARVTFSGTYSATVGQIIDTPEYNTPDGNFRGCYWHDHAAWGTRIKGNRHIIDGCRFDGNPILINPEIASNPYWQESGWVDGAVVRNTHITNTGGEGIMVLETESTYSGHTNLLFEGNHIVNCNRGISLDNCDGVTVRNNTYENVNDEVWTGSYAENVTVEQGPQEPPSGIIEDASGLPWNSIFFPASGDMDTKRETFETWLGHPLDGLMWFVPRATWLEMQWLEPEGVAAEGYKVICIPTQPDTQNNSETASGSRNGWWETWGQALTTAGLNTNRTIIRLNWEANAGAWYPWTWDKPNVSSFVAAWTNAAKSIRKNAPNVLFNLNHAENNWDSDAAGGRTWAQCTDLILPYKDAAGKPLLNIVGVDSYNHSPGVRYPSNANASTRLSNWYQQTNRTGGDFVPSNYDPPTRGSVYKYAADHLQADGSQLWFWHDEWGASHSEWQSGGDDPYFFQFMRDWFYQRRIANGGVLLGECIYNDPGDPSSYQHQLMDWDTGLPTTENYNGALKYKQLWQP